MLLIVPLGDRLETRRLASVLLAVTTVAAVAAGLATSFPVLLIASLVTGTTSVVAQVLIPFAADLAPDATRGRIVGRVVSGLLTGILLARTVSSLVAHVSSWRVVYLGSAVLMAGLGVALRYALPRRSPGTTVGYGQLLRSAVGMLRTHGPLRRRAGYQAAMFGAFSAFWTTVSYLLTGSPYRYSQLGVALFALVGAGGALIAPLAGRWADRGLGQRVTLIAFGVALFAFALAGFGRRDVLLLALAAVLLDMAVQASFIMGQHVIYGLDATARSRVNSVYIATFFVGGALGAQGGSIAYHLGGWTALTVFGAALPVLALAGWVTEPDIRRRFRPGSA
jgi:predicted MFS family arabinose efflux permease